MKTEISHPFPPLYSKDSRILILGTFPSVKSRENMFFYGHPQNRFWKVISAVLNEAVPQTIEEKTKLLLCNNIALWDSIARCRIEGSSDSSISDVMPNDMSKIFNTAQIEAVFCNGKKSHELYKKYVQPQCEREAICLPSTSPANASWSLAKLILEYEEKLSPYLSHVQNR